MIKNVKFAMAKNVNLSFNSFNTRGLGNGAKRRTVFQWLQNFHKGVTLLQETHSTKADEKQWLKDWGGKIVFNHGSSMSRGVPILFPIGLDVTINDTIIDEEGRILLVDITIDENVVLMNVYAPTKDKMSQQITFLNIIKDILDNYIDRNLLIGGDFNMCIYPKLDKKGGTFETTSVYAEEIKQTLEQFNLADIWRVINPQQLKYTWRGNTKRGTVLSRLDYWFTSIHMIYDLDKIDIKPGIKSDHSIIKINFNIKDSQQRGRGFWNLIANFRKMPIT